MGFSASCEESQRVCISVVRAAISNLLSPLLAVVAPIARRSASNLFRFVDGGLLNALAAIHDVGGGLRSAVAQLRWSGGFAIGLGKERCMRGLKRTMC